MLTPADHISLPGLKQDKKDDEDVPQLTLSEWRRDVQSLVGRDLKIVTFMIQADGEFESTLFQEAGLVSPGVVRSPMLRHRGKRQEPGAASRDRVGDGPGVGYDTAQAFLSFVFVRTDSDPAALFLLATASSVKSNPHTSDATGQSGGSGQSRFH